jgi:hypothetical protein
MLSNSKCSIDANHPTGDINLFIVSQMLSLCAKNFSRIAISIIKSAEEKATLDACFFSCFIFKLLCES